MVTAIKHLIDHCTNIDKETVILILFDESTNNIAMNFRDNLMDITKYVQMKKLLLSTIHGIEPPNEIREAMLNCNIIFCLTKNSLAHTKARMLANEKGIGFLSLPDFNYEMLNNEAIYADYSKILDQVIHFTHLLTNANSIQVTSIEGTDIKMDIEGRKGNCCPGIINHNYLLGSPPDIEANIAPLENRTEGIIIVDGSITDEKIGLLSDNVKIEVLHGIAVSFQSLNDNCMNRLNALFTDKPFFNIVGEFGVGFNNKAFLCGNMLIDEGTRGCVHFGLGSNATIGGSNQVPFHLDFVIRKPTVKLDCFTVIKEGEFCYEQFCR